MPPHAPYVCRTCVSTAAPATQEQREPAGEAATAAAFKPGAAGASCSSAATGVKPPQGSGGQLLLGPASSQQKATLGWQQQQQLHSFAPADRGQVRGLQAASAAGERDSCTAAETQELWDADGGSAPTAPEHAAAAVQQAAAAELDAAADLEPAHEEPPAPRPRRQVRVVQGWTNLRLLATTSAAAVAVAVVPPVADGGDEQPTAAGVEPSASPPAAGGPSDTWTLGQPACAALMAALVAAAAASKTPARGGRRGGVGSLVPRWRCTCQLIMQHFGLVGRAECIYNKHMGRCKGPIYEVTSAGVQAEFRRPPLAGRAPPPTFLVHGPCLEDIRVSNGLEAKWGPGAKGKQRAVGPVLPRPAEAVIPSVQQLAVALTATLLSGSAAPAAPAEEAAEEQEQTQPLPLISLSKLGGAGSTATSAAQPPAGGVPDAGGGGVFAGGSNTGGGRRGALATTVMPSHILCQRLRALHPRAAAVADGLAGTAAVASLAGEGSGEDGGSSSSSHVSAPRSSRVLPAAAGAPHRQGLLGGAGSAAMAVATAKHQQRPTLRSLTGGAQAGAAAAGLVGSQHTSMAPPPALPLQRLLPPAPTMAAAMPRSGSLGAPGSGTMASVPAATSGGGLLESAWVELQVTAYTELEVPPEKRLSGGGGSGGGGRSSSSSFSQGGCASNLQAPAVAVCDVDQRADLYALSPGSWVLLTASVSDAAFILHVRPHMPRGARLSPCTGIQPFAIARVLRARPLSPDAAGATAAGGGGGGGGMTIVELEPSSWHWVVDRGAVEPSKQLPGIDLLREPDISPRQRAQMPLAAARVALTATLLSGSAAPAAPAEEAAEEQEQTQPLPLISLSKLGGAGSTATSAAQPPAGGVPDAGGGGVFAGGSNTGGGGRGALATTVMPSHILYQRLRALHPRAAAVADGLAGTAAVASLAGEGSGEDGGSSSSHVSAPRSSRVLPAAAGAPHRQGLLGGAGSAAMAVATAEHQQRPTLRSLTGGAQAGAAAAGLVGSQHTSMAPPPALPLLPLLQLPAPHLRLAGGAAAASEADPGLRLSADTDQPALLPEGVAHLLRAEQRDALRAALQAAEQRNGQLQSQRDALRAALQAAERRNGQLQSQRDAAWAAALQAAEQRSRQVQQQRDLAWAASVLELQQRNQQLQEERDAAVAEADSVWADLRQALIDRLG
ncbi:hypothetical protein HYH02_015012 [Chlamydomonas schloesseri]|uniref:Uncharacterized protein n=1 Tax=Chlamydomonas schloesseri TaxID=2026947 RepID=A0A835SI90_9CHLO|nr:hypothetical protein HYH02_015012 [Chlamydomonas schloesseri]|eukprot:KAG2425402.1 hypothetical protein HYH02_015012 [Chlamydomonas schloesseri]